MKQFVPVTALLALLGSSSVFAANLNIPMSFEFLALDGQKVESSVFNHKSDLALTDGTHKIAIRYSDMIEDDFSDSQTFVKSAPFIVTIAVTGDHQYTLKPADGDIVKEPKKFATAPKVVIKSNASGAVDYQIEQTDFEEESFVSRLFSGNQAQDVELAAAAATGAGVASAASMPAAPVKPSAVSATAPQAATDVNITPTDKGAHAEQMLQYWWLQADDKTRKEFMSWAIKQL